MLYKKIVLLLKKEGEPLSQSEIRKKMAQNVNRAVLLGYLRALVDRGDIKSKSVGKALVYYL